MLERILVPIDASGDALLALPLACQLAEATGARLRLLRIVLAYASASADSPAPSVGTYPRIAERTLYAAGPRAEEATLRVGRAGEIPAAIAAEARACGADLIVMATHACGGFDRIAHPSVAEAALANTTVPLLLVNAARGQVESGPEAPLVVAVDGTPQGAASLPFAVRYARALGSEILLLRVVAPQVFGGDSAARSDDLTALADAQRYLDRLAAWVNACGVPAQGRALFGPVAGTIAAVAEQAHAGVIALSTHSVQGAARLVRGGLAAGLLRAESRPILLVRRDAAGALQPFSIRHYLPGAQQIVGGGATLG